MNVDERGWEHYVRTHITKSPCQHSIIEGYKKKRFGNALVCIALSRFSTS